MVSNLLGLPVCLENLCCPEGRSRNTVPAHSETSVKPWWNCRFLTVPIGNLRWRPVSQNAAPAHSETSVKLACILQFAARCSPWQKQRKESNSSFFCQLKHQDANCNINASFTEVSPRFHYAQARCFGKHVSKRRFPIGTGRKRQFDRGFTEVSLGVSQPRPPISMLLTAGFGSSRKTMSLKSQTSSLKLGGGGQVCPRSCLDSFTCALRLSFVNRGWKGHLDPARFWETNSASPPVVERYLLVLMFA